MGENLTAFQLRRLGFAQISPEWEPNARSANYQGVMRDWETRLHQKMEGTGMIYPKEGKVKQHTLGQL